MSGTRENNRSDAKTLRESAARGIKRASEMAARGKITVAIALPAFSPAVVPVIQQAGQGMPLPVDKISQERQLDEAKDWAEAEKARLISENRRLGTRPDLPASPRSRDQRDGAAQNPRKARRTRER